MILLASVSSSPVQRISPPALAWTISRIRCSLWSRMREDQRIIPSSIGTCRSLAIAASSALPNKGATSTARSRTAIAPFTIPPSRS